MATNPSPSRSVVGLLPLSLVATPLLFATTLLAPCPASAQSVTFDFDNAPLHASLPIDLTVGSLSAHFSATGQGFSIQTADVLGFTPPGFAGYCVYPNSVFAADLLVAFSRPVVDFSILYAPEEYGCDDSATMRATGFQGTTFVATNTATVPVPGTWPSGTLTLAAPQGFDHVVVHYDSPPPTCQDWGPIFMADNVIVTPIADPLVFADGFESGDLSAWSLAVP